MCGYPNGVTLSRKRRARNSVGPTQMRPRMAPLSCEECGKTYRSRYRGKHPRCEQCRKNPSVATSSNADDCIAPIAPMKPLHLLDLGSDHNLLKRYGASLMTDDALSFINPRLERIEQILEILKIKATRAATLVGSNPFPGKTNKFNAVATSFFAHNFIKTTIDGLEVGIEPLRKNFKNDTYCPFPIYDSAIGLHTLLSFGFSSYLIWHYILFPMIQDLALEDAESVHLAFLRISQLFQI